MKKLWLGLWALGVLCASRVVALTGLQGQNPKPYATFNSNHTVRAPPRPQAHALNANARHNVRSLQTLQCPTKKKPCAILPCTPHLAGALYAPPHLSTAEIHGFESYASVHTAETKPSRYPWALRARVVLWC